MRCWQKKRYAWWCHKRDLTTSTHDQDFRRGAEEEIRGWWARDIILQNLTITTCTLRYVHTPHHTFGDNKRVWQNAWSRYRSRSWSELIAGDPISIALQSTPDSYHTLLIQISSCNINPPPKISGRGCLSSRSLMLDQSTAKQHKGSKSWDSRTNHQSSSFIAS